jgi:hypothetical protein
VNVTGTINVYAANVTIRNFRVDAAWGTYGIRLYSGASATIEDGEITRANGAAVYGDNWTARRLNVHHMGADAFKTGGDTTIENSWIHHLGMSAGAHADGVQIENGSNFVFRGNFFDLPWYSWDADGEYRVNAAFFINGWVGPISNVTIDGNWLTGGNYTIYALSQSNTKVTNNEFGPVVGSGNWQELGAQFGLINGNVAAWSGNTWYDGSPA